MLKQKHKKSVNLTVPKFSCDKTYKAFLYFLQENCNLKLRNQAAYYQFFFVVANFSQEPCVCF